MELLSNIDASGVKSVLITFFASMLPVLELRAAIPLGVGFGLTPVASMIVSVIGNMVPVPFIILFIRKIFAWMQKKSERLAKLVKKLEEKAYSKQELLYKWEVLGLIILVAIPLPGTGAWTGALVAAMFDIRLKTAIPCILIGVLIAGVIVTGLTAGFAGLF